MLEAAGFVQVRVDLKEESRELIAGWMPGSKAEDYVMSANITAVKPPAGVNAGEGAASAVAEEAPAPAAAAGG